MSDTRQMRTIPARRRLGLLVVAALLAGGLGFTASPAQAAGPGSMDATFNPGTGANGSVYSVAFQTDGKVLIGGAFDSYNGTLRSGIARLNANGTLDTTFNPGTGANGTVYSVVEQADGRILIGGSFGAFNGTARNGVARLNSNGTLDTTFNPGTGADGTVWSVAVQADGRILIGGSFGFINGTARGRIARLNANGTLDTTFNPGTGANSTLYSVVVQADGRILIGGSFSLFNGTARGRIARLNANGTLDTTFNPGTGANDLVQPVVVQADGKIVIGGLFTSYNGTERGSIARLNANGTLDTTFNPGTGVDGWVTSLAVRFDGKVVIGGLFTSYNGTQRSNIARSNADGTLDTTFNPGTGTNNTVLSAVEGADGRILIGGVFTSYDGTARNRIARLGVAEGAPGQPGRPVVVPGLQSLSVTVVPPITGGVPTLYVATATATGSVATGSGNSCNVVGVLGSCAIVGLAADGKYRVSVVAINASGSSPAGFPRPQSPQSVTPGAGSVVPEFADVPAGSFFVRATSMLKLRGITEGTNAAGDVYSPQQPVNRQQMALFLWRMAGSPDSPATCGFIDEAAIAVSARVPACWLKVNGITTSNPYEPSGVVNRQQMAAFLWRFAGKPFVSASCGFTDEADIATYARVPACWLKGTDITDNNPYRPTVEVTRAQMAAFLYRLGAELDLWFRVDS